MRELSRSRLIAAAGLSVIAGAQLAGGDAEARPVRLVVLGDSLSSGIYIGEGQAVPAVLEQSLRARGYDVTVANAGVTNDTSWNGLARLDRDVPAGTDAVIVELGANDRLRSIAASTTGGYLNAIVQRLRARGIKVLLAGFKFPRDGAGDPYGYDAMYRSVARSNGVPLYPDIYAGIASHPGYTVLDGAHPSVHGVQRIVSGILPSATRLVAQAGSGRRGN